MDVLVKVIENLAVNWTWVRWGHELLLGPLKLTVQPRNPVLQEAAGGHKSHVNRENLNTGLMHACVRACNLVSRGIQWSAATRPIIPMLESWSENSSLSSSCSSLISSSSWDVMPFTDWEGDYRMDSRNSCGGVNLFFLITHGLLLASCATLQHWCECTTWESLTRFRVPSGAAKWHWMYELKTWTAGWTKQPRGKCSSSWISVSHDSKSLS